MSSDCGVDIRCAFQTTLGKSLSLILNRWHLHPMERALCIGLHGDVCYLNHEMWKWISLNFMLTDFSFFFFFNFYNFFSTNALVNEHGLWVFRRSSTEETSNVTKLINRGKLNETQLNKNKVNNWNRWNYNKNVPHYDDDDPQMHFARKTVNISSQNYPGYLQLQKMFSAKKRTKQKQQSNKEQEQ